MQLAHSHADSHVSSQQHAASSDRHRPTALTWALCRAEAISPNAGRLRRGEATPPNAGGAPPRRFLWLCFPCTARFSRKTSRRALNLRTLADSDFILTQYCFAAAATAMPVYITCKSGVVSDAGMLRLGAPPQLPPTTTPPPPSLPPSLNHPRAVLGDPAIYTPRTAEDTVFCCCSYLHVRARDSPPYNNDLVPDFGIFSVLLLLSCDPYECDPASQFGKEVGAVRGKCEEKDQEGRIAVI